MRFPHTRIEHQRRLRLTPAVVNGIFAHAGADGTPAEADGIPAGADDRRAVVVRAE
ncbi:hypothetical protein [Streptomyces triticagri]|uniref:hypothetical protein n=1 Tax=Streptomyces triticagri TaxID=2293568 RepID=UPI0018F31689|nr:hypothetical protein [Streptomyces triticagri]